MTNICVIPARGGSKGIERKNIKSLYGKPLVGWTIEQALAAEEVDIVVVSTDDDEIADIANSFGATVHRRSEENSRDDVHAVHAVIECLNSYEESGIIIDSVGMLLATSPLRSFMDISRAFILLEHSDCDSVVSMSHFDKPISSLRYLDQSDIMSPIVDVDLYEVNRQDIKRPLYEGNGSIFISSVDHLKKVKSFHQGRVKAYKMPRSRSIDINSMDDWTVAEAILMRNAIESEKYVK